MGRQTPDSLRRVLAYPGQRYTYSARSGYARGTGRPQMSWDVPVEAIAVLAARDSAVRERGSSRREWSPQ
jgi:hypothetical protein